jgi:hypothetical protein
MAQVKFISATDMGKQLGLTKDQMTWRLRRGDINATKISNWTWLIPVSELERVRTTDWYKKAAAKVTT